MKSLTKKQAEYLAESAKGKTYEEISDIFYVTVDTVTRSIAEARKRSETKTTLQCFARAVAREEIGIDHEGLVFIPNHEYEGGDANGTLY